MPILIPDAEIETLGIWERIQRRWLSHVFGKPVHAKTVKGELAYERGYLAAKAEMVDECRQCLNGCSN